jgi:hypothetical protein
MAAAAENQSMYVETVNDESAADGETALAAVSDQVRRLRLPLAVLIRAGSVAGAILSIVGLVVLFVPSLDRTDAAADKVSTVLEDGEEIKLGVDPDVERMTYGRWLELETGSSAGVSPDEQRVPGVNVHYTAEFPAHAGKAPFKARFTLKDQTNVTRHQHIAMGRLDADRDLCRCAEFVPVPTGSSSYRVLVELYRPEARYAAPVLSNYTDWFSAAEPVTAG